MRFPTLCVDDFYINPEKVRDFALSLEYSKPEGIYPGERTKYLHEIDKKFFHQFCEKLLLIMPVHARPRAPLVWLKLCVPHAT